MKYSIYIILLGILVACNNPKQQGKSLAEERAETDTILAFQGIKISELLDSALYAKLTENGPIILYDKDKNSFALTTVTINDNVAYLDEVVHSLCLKGNFGKY